MQNQSGIITESIYQRVQLVEMLTIQQEIGRLMDDQLNNLKSHETRLKELIKNGTDYIKSLQDAVGKLRDTLKAECSQMAHCADLIVRQYNLLNLSP